MDQGVYQCRSSASPYRYKEDVNVYQHWKIEEAPITDMNCNQGWFDNQTKLLFITYKIQIFAVKIYIMIGGQNSNKIYNQLCLILQ